VKSDIAYDGKRGRHGHAERLNSSIEIFVVHGILIVPHAVIWPRHLIADKENPVASRDRLVLSHRCARSCPSHDGRLHSHGGTDC
jgi:hypothetical protein